MCALVTGVQTCALPIERTRDTDTAGDLLGRLSEAGAHLLVTTLDGIEDGYLAAKPQPADGLSTAPKITIDDARIRWVLPARSEVRLVGNACGSTLRNRCRQYN